MFNGWNNGSSHYLTLMLMIKQLNAKSVQIQGIATIHAFRFMQ